MLPLVKMNRHSREEDGIFSTIVLNGMFVCLALENDEHMIQAGIYRCTRDFTGRHKWWRLEDRNGRTLIEIHIGNTEDASKGCILFGSTLASLNGKKALLRSGDALEVFLESLEDLGYEDFDLQITESF
jgi:hypothetical protein